MKKELLIKLFAQIENDDQFINGMLLIRKKDSNGKRSSDYPFKRYIFNSLDDFNEKEEEIKFLADSLNGRLYLNPCIKSYKDVALDTMEEQMNLLRTNNFSSFKKIYDSSVNKNLGIKSKRKWIIDIDDCKNDELVKELESIYALEMFHINETKNGYHLIVNPHKFDNKNLELLKVKYGFTYELKKNSLTPIYYKKD